MKEFAEFAKTIVDSIDMGPLMKIEAEEERNEAILDEAKKVLDKKIDAGEVNCMNALKFAVEYSVASEPLNPLQRAIHSER
ncbi:hypothetical protein LKD70_17455 [Ruminococcus sp. CLA-AA-H200]|uniref:Uncharacterized protein n=1 Tax=Ruminococcus turbiniformis TaxID=2881258 RepID=A0ABS8G1X6_9FIRM|nr:hypothetical protein [Ruminococcus turbiniformis]MCC2256171.1 hypothetical protein [Ruminococcus turbiniformis]